MVFGVNSSPFILNAVLRHHIESFNDIDPEFVKKLLESFFVDDLVTGMDSTEGAFQLYQKAKERLKQGGFTLRKWKSNREDLIDEIQAKEKSMQLEQPEKNNSEIQDSFATETLEGNAIGKDSNHTKVLEINWYSEEMFTEGYWKGETHFFRVRSYFARSGKYLEFTTPNV